MNLCGPLCLCVNKSVIHHKDKENHKVTQRLGQSQACFRPDRVRKIAVNPD